MGDAIARAEKYQGAVSFRVAALSQLGGARCWLALSSDRRRWIKQDDPGAEDPEIDEDIDDLPKLPIAKKGLWAFVFVDDQGQPLKPEIIIGSPDSGDGDSRENSVRAIQSARNEQIAVFTAGLKQANEDARAATRQALDTLNHVVPHLNAIIEQKTKENDALEAKLAGHKSKMDELTQENNALLVTLAELSNRSDFAETIRHLFGQKPELLVGALKDLASGLFQNFSGAERAPRVAGTLKSAATRINDAES